MSDDRLDRAQEAIDEARRLARERWGWADPDGKVDELVAAMRPTMERLVAEMDAGIPFAAREQGMLTGAVLQALIEAHEEGRAMTSDASGPDDDADAPPAAVRALADHLTHALETYLETHLPPTGKRAGADALTPKALLAGVTLFHASFLADIARGAFPNAAPTFFEVQVRNFADALEVMYEEHDEEGEEGSEGPTED